MFILVYFSVPMFRYIRLSKIFRTDAIRYMAVPVREVWIGVVYTHTKNTANHVHVITESLSVALPASG
jgi:hypothetical protein